MAKGTVILLFILAVIASLLVGINIGKNIQLSKSAIQLIPTPTNIQPKTYNPSPTTYNPQPTTIPSTPSALLTPDIRGTNASGNTTYSNKGCGFTFSYPGSYINEKSVNNQSIILVDPDNPSDTIATTCSASIPRPPVSQDKIEATALGGVPATLYHDQTDGGQPRDDVIVKNPYNNLEIIIAGYGPTFQSALASFRFIQ